MRRLNKVGVGAVGRPEQADRVYTRRNTLRTHAFAGTNRPDRVARTRGSSSRVKD